MSTTAHRVLVLVADHASRRPDQVVPADNLETLGFDSLDHVELLMAVEEEFGFEISDDEAETVGSVGELVTFVERRLS